jgi:hypothetical protein
VFPELADAVKVTAVGPPGVRQESQVISKGVEELKNRLFCIIHKLEAVPNGAEQSSPKTTQGLGIKRV